MTRRSGLALLAMVALAACQQEKAPQKAVAGGEILDGSISDAMLPLDAVRSQAPLAPPSGAARKSDAPEDAPATDAPAAEPPAAEAAAPAPAATETP